MEKELINKSKLRDKNAFAHLINIYRKQLFSYILKRCGNRELAEDILQETLIKIWKNLNNYKEKEKFSSWIFSIAHNLTIDFYRKKRIDFKAIDEVEEFHTSENIQKEIEFDERKELLKNALGSLTKYQKEVFLLRQHGGLTFREIAELTQQPLNTILSHMNYAMKKLKKILKEENAA